MKPQKNTIEAVVRGLEQRTFTKGEETWGQWLKKISRCKSEEDLLALIHRGFSAKTESLDEEINRLEFYFLVAAGSYPSRIDRLAYTTLCSKFLNPFVNGSKADFEGNIYSHPKVLSLLSKFYTLDMLNTIENSPIMGGRYAWETTERFLKVFLTWHGVWCNHDRHSDNIYLWVISVLHRIGDLGKIYGYSYFECLMTQECIDGILVMAVTDSKFSTVSEVCREMRPLAQLYILALDFKQRR